MPSIDWPSSLPCPARGVSEQRIPPYVDDPASVGAPRRRVRFTRSLRRFDIVLANLTRTQVEALENFWTATTGNGAYPFNWTHPRPPVGGGDTILAVRFSDFPQISQTGTRYAAQVVLEEI